MGTENNDVLAKWKKDCLEQMEKEDEEMIQRVAEEDGLIIDRKTLNANIPANFVEDILDNPILDFADMMIRMQRALFLQSQAKRADPSKLDIDEMLRNECEKDGYDWDWGADDIGLENNISVAPELLDVKNATELFLKGELDAYIADAEAKSNNLQRDLILSLGGSEQNAEEESCPVSSSRTSLAPVKRPCEETSSPRSPPKRPKIPQLRPLTTLRRKGTILSPRAQAIPNPNASAKFTSVNLNLSRGPAQELNSQSRKIAVAVRKNPINTNLLRQRAQPAVPQRVTIRPAPSVDSVPKVVSVESLQKSPFKMQVAPLNSPKGAIPSSTMKLPSTITVLPAQPDKQGVLYPNQKSVPVSSSQPPVVLRPASARKSPHKSTMYTSAANPVPIKPKTPDLSPVAQLKFVPIQPRLSVGQHMTSTDSGNTDSEEVNADELMPQIMSTEGGVTSFVSKLNSLAKEAPKITIPPEKVRTPIKQLTVAQGSWLLGCQTCGLTYPLLCDNKYRQHLMIDHSIEVDDKEIQAIKFFAKTMFKCKKCQAVFFKNREEHHIKCTPNVKIDEAFQEVPFSNKDPEVIKCGICNVVFDTRINLRGHLAEKHKEVVNSTLVDPKYRCSRCLKAFSDSATLTSHVAHCMATQSEKDSILEIARSLLMCDICQRSHYSVNEVQICYANKKLIRCMLCLYTCISRQNFITHMTNFHRKNRVGIACPFCPASEVAPVRAQFEHIVSQHYNPAIEAYLQRKASLTTLPPVSVAKGAPKVIGIPVSQSFLQTNLLNSNPRAIYQRNAAGNLVLSHVSPGTSLRPLRPTNMGNRPTLINNATMGSGGNIRYMVAPSQIGNSPNIMRAQAIFKTIPSPSPISILATKLGGGTTANSTSVTSSTATTDSNKVPGASIPISTVNTTQANIRLTPVNIRPLNSSNFRSVNPVGIRSINPANLRPINTANIQSVNPANIGSITPISIRPINPANTRSITASNIRSINGANIRPISPANIRTINSTNFRSVNPANFRPINPVNIRYINSANIRSFTSVSMSPTPTSIRPVTSVSSSPTTPVNIRPVTLVNRSPTAPVNIRPVTSVNNSPATPVKNFLVTSTHANRNPNSPANSRSFVLVNSGATMPVNIKPLTPVNSRPAATNSSPSSTSANIINSDTTNNVKNVTSSTAVDSTTTKTTAGNFNNSTTPVSTSTTTATTINNTTTNTGEKPTVNTSTTTPTNTNNSTTSTITANSVNPPTDNTSTASTNNTATDLNESTTKPLNSSEVNSSATKTPVSINTPTTNTATEPFKEPVVNTNTTTPVSSKNATSAVTSNTSTEPVNSQAVSTSTTPVSSTNKSNTSVTTTLSANNITTTGSSSSATPATESINSSAVNTTTTEIPVSSNSTTSTGISSSTTKPVNSSATTPVNINTSSRVTASSTSSSTDAVVSSTTNSTPVNTNNNPTPITKITSPANNTNTTAGNNTSVNRSSTLSTTGTSGVKTVVRSNLTNSMPVITGISGTTGRPKVININTPGGQPRVVSIGSIPFVMRPKIGHNNSSSSSSPETPVRTQLVSSSTTGTPVSRPMTIVGKSGAIIGSTFIKPLATSTPNSTVNLAVSKFCQIAPKPTPAIVSMSSVSSVSTKVVGEASLTAPENSRSSNLSNDNDSVLEEINMNEETADSMDVDSADSILGF